MKHIVIDFAAEVLSRILLPLIVVGSIAIVAIKRKSA